MGSRSILISIENAEDALKALIPEFARGAYRKGLEAQTVCTYFRQRGICQMLAQGVASGLHLGQMQDAGAYLHWLRAADDDEKITSWAQPFYAAVGGGYREAAEGIASESRMTHNPSWEHEDDFLYVAFLMKRYFLGCSEQEQTELLDRYAVVLEGAGDAKLDLCRSLFEKDQSAFDTAFEIVLEKRRSRVDAQLTSGSMTDAHADWIRPYAAEGLAILRLAEREGFSLSEVYSDIPTIAREESPYIWSPDAWKNLDFTPQLRP